MMRCGCVGFDPIFFSYFFKSIKVYTHNFYVCYKFDARYTKVKNQYFFVVSTKIEENLFEKFFF